MNRFLQYIFCILLCACASNKPTIEHSPNFDLHEKVHTSDLQINPEFPGGSEGYIDFMKEHLKYPKIDRINRVQGTIHVKFIVTKNGELKNIEIIEGLSETINKEVIRFFKKMPNWKPGVMDGKAVNVQLVIPIKFSI